PVRIRVFRRFLPRLRKPLAPFSAKAGAMIRPLHPHTRPQRTFDPDAVSKEARECGYEPQDWPVRKIFIGLPFLFLLLAIALGGAALVMRGMAPPWPTMAASEAAFRLNPPGPRLDTHQRLDRTLRETRQLGNLAKAPV